VVVKAANISARPRRAATPASEVIWHDLECGSYRADLPLWRELADGHPGPILDVGAGSGRVALSLLEAGHSVTALDLDPTLLGALKERAATNRIETACADARSFALSRRDFALCIVPMQTIQLLGGPTGRVAFLRRAHAHLRRGGLLACAILSALEPFDCPDGEIGPAAESAYVDGILYVSRATRVGMHGRRVVIERQRQILVSDERGEGGAPGCDAAAAPAPERNVIELDHVTAPELEREATGAGLRPESAREVPPTDDHAGSAVVMLRA